MESRLHIDLEVVISYRFESDNSFNDRKLGLPCRALIAFEHDSPDAIAAYTG
jgi:hypothetical protein